MVTCRSRVITTTITATIIITIITTRSFPASSGISSRTITITTTIITTISSIREDGSRVAADRHAAFSFDEARGPFMDKKIVGVIGAITGLAVIDQAQAA